MWLFIRGLCAFHKLLNLSELRDPHRAPTVSPPCPLPTPTLRGALQRAWFSVDGTQEVLDKFRDSWAKPALNLPQLPLAGGRGHCRAAGQSRHRESTRLKS